MGTYGIYGGAMMKSVLYYRIHTAVHVYLYYILLRCMIGSPEYAGVIEIRDPWMKPLGLIGRSTRGVLIRLRIHFNGRIQRITVIKVQLNPTESDHCHVPWLTPRGTEAEMITSEADIVSIGRGPGIMICCTFCLPH